MSETTGIEWTDTTWNPVTGCTRVSPGCQNCYAERLTATRLARQPKYKGLAVIDDGKTSWTGAVRTHPAELDKPFTWTGARRVFVCSMSDLFHKDVPDAFIEQVLAVIEQTPQHTYQVLTKRPARMADLLEDVEDLNAWDWSLANLWCGTSVEDQRRADERLGELARCAGPVRFVSCEPLLGLVNLRPWLEGGLEWVIAGGETGPGYRRCDPWWLRDLRDQCALYGVPFFMKQMAGRQPIPEDLLVRQFPDTSTDAPSTEERTGAT